MKLKHWIRIIIFAVVAGVLILVAAIFLSVPEARDVTGMYGFYKEEDRSMDVILIGPSTIYTSFYSPLAYEEQGFTSYAISTGGLSGAMYKYAMEEALQTQAPSLFVVEISGFCDENQRDSAAMRRFADSIKKGSNRNAFIEEMVPEEEQESYRIPFLKYHSGWDRLRGCFKTLVDKLAINRRGYSVTKNFCAYADTVEGSPESGTYELSREGMKSLEEFLGYIKGQGLDNVMFLRCPNRNLPKKGDTLIPAERMIQSAGFDYLDMAENAGDIWQLDWDKDFYDAGHLNIFGAEKFTKYLSKELTSRYEINTVHEENVQNQWDTCASWNETVLENAERKTEEHFHEGLYTQSDFLE